MASSDFSYISGDPHLLSEVSIVLLGCKDSGKSSAGNTILGQDVFDLQENVRCLKRHGDVAGRKITVVEAPGWCYDNPVEESTEHLKEEIILSVSQCPPGPHAVLVVINVGKNFTENDKEILAGYLSLLGDNIWSHTIVLFTYGDSLGDTTIERHIESKGQALQWLVEKCGNRYHVFNNNMDDDSQVAALLEKIEKTMAGNKGRRLITDVKTLCRSKEDEDGRTRGTNYSQYFINVLVYVLEFLSFSSQQVSLPVWSITRSLYFRMGFSRFLQFPPTSQKHAVVLKSGTEKNTQSASSLHPDASRNERRTLEDTELFTPELVENYHKDKNRNEYRFLCPHAGQFECKLTSLVFEMEGKGVVMYRVVPWDNHILAGLHHMDPAGPLYSIDCLEGSITYLHLPHCELHWDVTGTDVVQLTVACVTGENVENLQPLKVTNTRVIIDVQRQRLSCVGVVKELQFQSYPVRAQVLLFCKKTEEHRMSKLYVHLLPGNVPVKEVQKQHNSNTYISTTSECQLTPGYIYSPCCKTTDHDFVSQPKDETFNCDYSTEFPPTFEVPFNPEVDQFTLSLLDENGQEVWKPCTFLLTGADLDVDEQRHILALAHISSSLYHIGDCIEGHPNEASFNPELKIQDFTHSADVYKGFVQTPLIYHKQPKGDMAFFIPEMLESCPKDRNSCEYRFVCPHAGQFKCELTNLVFEMEGKGVVIYRIGSWEGRLLDGLPQNEPAGPVYSIDCHEGSINYLHLPHCETCTDEVKLTVAHVTGGKVKILQPLKVTDTHVIVQIHGLSLFALIKALLFQAYPIRAQVLLFCKKVTGNHRMNKLHIHLLPVNVPVKEVQKQHECGMYIETTSMCKLSPGKTYEPCCKSNDCEYKHQPEDETFECDYGPNYHPTFEVLFNTEVNQVTLSLLDEKRQVVWAPRTVLLTGTESEATNMDPTGADFVDQHREAIIQRVSSVMEIADCLIARRMITDEMLSNISAKETPQAQMREVYKYLDSAGRAAKAQFYQILQEKYPYLVTELQSTQA
ncbi:uncharacterized protein LOC113650939 isoform X2 [Tachysurus fulvidraco]|uniref:uncharacterized protein LOC113650939 isoform X2 n=1 Tax=Tachysurus fulvidraco TaxID=1234273 RepID=UPI001FEFB94A|nr:uncharacterized protein LOC113650939 isoform X2 [Tachysurus fulvidraco]